MIGRIQYDAKERPIPWGFTQIRACPLPQDFKIRWFTESLNFHLNFRWFIQRRSFREQYAIDGFLFPKGRWVVWLPSRWGLPVRTPTSAPSCRHPWRHPGWRSADARSPRCRSCPTSLPGWEMHTHTRTQKKNRNLLISFWSFGITKPENN